MRATRCIILAVCLWTVVQPVFAGVILFSTDDPLLFDSQDEEVAIRVDVKNTHGKDIFGSFTWTVRDRNDAGDARSFTDMRVMFGDQKYTEFAVHPGEGHEYLVDIAFDYADAADPEAVYHVALEGVQVWFMDEQALSINATPRKTLESIQIKMTKGPEQAQSGASQASGTGGSNQVTRVKSSPENIESLSELLEKETIELSEKKELLKSHVLQSDLYASVSEILNDTGFLPQDIGVTLGRKPYPDEFMVVFVNENSTEVRVAGAMGGDEIQSINLEYPGTILPAYGIERNETFLSLDSALRGDGYAVVKSGMSITPGNAAIRYFYEKGTQQKTVNVTIRNGEPVSVALEEPPGGIHFLFAAAVLALTALSALLAYRFYLRCSTTGYRGEAVGSTGPVQNPVSPVELLEKAYDDCMGGDLKEAFSKTGRALRLHVSLQYNGREHLTNLQALLLLAAGKNPDYTTYKEMLSVCDAVVYGCDEPDKDAFMEMYRQMKSILGDGRSPG